MGYELESMLVVGVASSALFNLEESDAVFREQGEAHYRSYQAAKLNDILEPGVAFSFVQRLLTLNDLSQDGKPLVEVIVLSRNDPETGLRVLRSVTAHGLPISRAIFMQGRSPYKFIDALGISLFLSANEVDVREAIDMGFAAGRVLGSPVADTQGSDLRIAFDFDGVLADDSSERVMQAKGLVAFHANEVEKVEVPLPEGRLTEFLRAVNRIQDVEDSLADQDHSYNRRLHVAIVTARNAPSHERVVRTLKAWGLRVNDAFFLGGIEKARVLRVLQPHIFFDDQLGHLEATAGEVPSVHVPFGVTNQVVEPLPLLEPSLCDTQAKKPIALGSV